MDCKIDMEEYLAHEDCAMKMKYSSFLPQNHKEITINSRSWHNISRYLDDFRTYYWLSKVCAG